MSYRCLYNDVGKLEFKQCILNEDNGRHWAVSIIKQGTTHVDKSKLDELNGKDVVNIRILTYLC